MDNALNFPELIIMSYLLTHELIHELSYELIKFLHK